MYLITPMELLQRFAPYRSVVFVGNAPSLRREKLGEWIDGHDIVVRFNQVPDPQYAADLGRHTHILVSNPYPESRTPVRLECDGVVLIISPQTRRSHTPELNVWVNGLPTLFTYTPDLVGIEPVPGRVGLTTGTYGLHLLSRLLAPSHTSVTGFTMFLGATDCRFDSDETPRGLKSHCMSEEAVMFIRVCNAVRSTLAVTSDIAWVAAAAAAPLRKDATIVRLRQKGWTPA
jgi:hypothetical protein